MIHSPDCAVTLNARHACSCWRDQTVSKQAVYDLISDMPLGYRTEGEHKVLERFADKLCAAVISMPNKC